MNKLFFALYFIVFAITCKPAFADIVEMNSPQEIHIRENNARKPLERPDPFATIKTAKDMEDFIRERLKHVTITSVSEDDAKQPSSMNVQPSEAYIAMQKEANRSLIDKMYDAALGRATYGEASKEERDYYVEQEKDNFNINAQKQEWEQPNFPVIGILLPNGDEVVAPAREHIPYMFTEIEILPSGVISFKEKITIVANAQKFKKGLSRVLPKYSTSRAGKKIRSDFSLISVSVNGNEVPYVTKEGNNSILLTPAEDYFLQPGVYNYEIVYMMDRRLWRYDDFYEFYWDVTGSSWNMVIARAGASLRLPNSSSPIGYSFMLGYPQSLSSEFTEVFRNEEGVMGFVTRRPLFVGEGMHIIASLDKKDFIKTDIGQRMSWLLSDYGDTWIALLGLIAIVVSYAISWDMISKKGANNQAGIRRSPVMLRQLFKGSFDRISFGTFLLDMFKRNIIDIQESGNDIVLVKKTDNLRNLNRFEKKALGNLFLNKESVLTVSKNNLLKVKRAYDILEKSINKVFKNFALMLNFGYLIFSIGMLLMVQAAIAFISIDKAQTISVLFGCTLTFAFYMLVLNKEFKNKLLGYAAKAFSIFIILFTLFILSIFINKMAAVFILVMIYTIFRYTKLFARREGLMKNSIKEANKFREFLMKNKETMSMGRDFLPQQANIFALDIDDYFPKNNNIKEYYRLDLVNKIVKMM